MDDHIGNWGAVPIPAIGGKKKKMKKAGNRGANAKLGGQRGVFPQSEFGQKWSPAPRTRCHSLPENLLYEPRSFSKFFVPLVSRTR